MFSVTRFILGSIGEMASLQDDGIVHNDTSEIQSLYEGSQVLITGATGFVGKVLVEALLRKTRTEKIYILIRGKRNKSTELRLEDFLNDQVFQKIKSSNPKRMSAIHLITGDCSLPDLGLSNDDRETIKNDVNIIFHGAATVRFNENLKVATAINVNAAKVLLELAKKMKNLHAIIHVSTAYSNSQFDEIFEKVYPVKKKELNLINLSNSIDKETAEKISESVLGESANTYVFTKQTTEDMIQREYSELPIAIYRPAIVIGAQEEPSPGYVDNLYGPTGLSIGIMSGVVHCLLIGSNVKADLVPVDYVVNCLIASAWETHNRFVTSQNLNRSVPVYNFVPHPKYSITWGWFTDEIVENARKAAPVNKMWHSFLFRMKSLLLYRLITTFVHFIPAWILDFALKSIGKKPSWVQVYERIDDVSAALKPFCTKEWRFSNENVQDLWRRMNKRDKELFPFNMERFDWQKYMDIYLQGVRIYMMKEKIDRTSAQKRAKRFKLIHYSFISSIIIFWGGLIYLLLHRYHGITQMYK